MMPDIPHELHEGSWLYVSARRQPTETEQELLDSVLVVCHRSGWPVIVGDAALSAQRRSQALRLADACIVAVSACPDVEAEIALARAERRPTIALRQFEQPPSPFLTDDHDDVRELLFHAREECLLALEEVLTDPEWQRQIALASPVERHV